MAEEIARQGPLTFARFMEIALMDPEVGYYARDEAGPGATADYLTSPEVHSAFAVLLTEQLHEMWRYLGEPEPFWLVELGAGSGAFAADVLGTGARMEPRFSEALRVAILEPSPALRRRQVKRLASCGGRVRWLDSVPGTGSALGPGCVFANEVLDALPVHRVVMRASGLRELYVVGEATSLHAREGELSTEVIAHQIAAGGGRLAPGQQGEVSLVMPHLVASCARLVDPGYVLFLDYGDPATLLYGERNPAGTLRCYWRHTMSRDPFRRVGEQDITGHVDLSAVCRAGEQAGLALLGVTRQARLLGRLGLSALADAVRQDVRDRALQRAHLAALDLLQDPDHLGRIAALVFGRRAPAASLSGFTDGAQRARRATVDLLELRSDPARLARTAPRRRYTG